MLTGTLFALAAGLMWGLVFVGPLLLPDYPATLHTFGRYLAFGLIALPLGWLDRRAAARADARRLDRGAQARAVGNVIYYLFLSSALQRAGGPLPTMIIGTLPVVIAITAKLRATRAGTRDEARPPWRRLLPSLLLIGAGIALVNQAELQHVRADPDGRPGALCDRRAARRRRGRLLDLVSDPQRRMAARASRPQPARLGHRAGAGHAAAGAGRLCRGVALERRRSGSPFEMPLGPRPAQFLLLMFTIGLLSSWLGTLCWNEASQRLPPTLAGQLIVFETLAALTYAFMLRGEWPDAVTVAGIVLLVGGVAHALRMPRLRNA